MGTLTISRRVLVGAAALLIGTAALAATSEERAAYRSAQKRAVAEYNAARQRCKTLTGTPRSVCYTEARVNARRADADAEAALRNTPRARRDARIAGANADYAIARARCGDRTGAQRTACIRAAKSIQSAAIADALRAGPRR